MKSHRIFENKKVCFGTALKTAAVLGMAVLLALPTAAASAATADVIAATADVSAATADVIAATADVSAAAASAATADTIAATADVSTATADSGTVISGTAAVGITGTAAVTTASNSDTTNTTGAKNSLHTNNGKNSLETDDFSIDFTFGINGTVRSGALVPVSIKATSAEDFEGTMRIIIPGSNSYYSEQESVAYEQGVTLTAGTEKTIEFCFENANNSTYCYFQLEDEKGNLILDQLVYMYTASSENALVGILSSDYTALNYFDRVTLNTDNYSGMASIQELTADTLPASESSLQSFSYLLVNSFDTSSLSAEQQQAILEWVEDGGLLILGGGPDYRQTISGFDDALSVTCGQPISGQLDVVNQISDKLDFTADDGFYEMTMENGSPLENVLYDNQLIWEKNYGTGRIVMTAFNLGMEPVSSWSFRAQLASQLLTEAASGDYSTRLSNINWGDSYYSYSSGANQLFSSNMLNEHLICGILIVFLISCAVIWGILKKKDRQMLFWLLLPLSAVLFTVILFLSTYNVRVRKPMTASLTMIEQKDNDTAENISMTILTPKTIWYNVQLDSSISDVEMQTDDYSFTYFSDLQEASSDDEDYTIALREDADGFSLRLKNDEAFSTKNIQLKGNGASGISGLTTDYKRTINGLSGTVTNETGHDLYAVYIVTSNGYICVGDIKAGESKTFTEGDNVITQYFYSISELNGYVPSDKQDQEKYSVIPVTYEMFYEEFLTYIEYEMADTECYTFGYVADFTADYVATAGIKENNYGIIFRKDEADYSDYDNAKSYSLFDYASCDGTWDNNDGELYALDVETTVELTGVLDHIYILMKQENSSYGITSDTTIYAWNWQTGSWDEILTDTDTMDFTDTGCPYLQDGYMNLKFTCKTEDEDYVPKLIAIGGND